MALLAAAVYTWKFDLGNTYSFEATSAVLTAMMLATVSRFPGWLEDGLGNRLLQFLGRISYSLYLVHTITGMKLMQLGAKYTHDSSLRATALLLAAFAVSIASAWILYFTVERWGINFGKRFKPRKAGAGA